MREAWEAAARAVAEVVLTRLRDRFEELDKTHVELGFEKTAAAYTHCMDICDDMLEATKRNVLQPEGVK